MLCDLSTSFHSSPYFLRCYEDLCRKYTSEGSRNAILIGLRRVTSVDMYINNNILLWGGYILGEIFLSRSSLTGDIYFIYVHTILRKNGYGMKLYQLFERAVIDRSASVGIKTVMIRISLKPCIVHSIEFWKMNGFNGSTNSVCLIKNIKLN